MIICKRCRQLKPWNAEKICFDCRDTREFKGKIGRLAIFNRALSLDEIAKLYARGVDKDDVKS